MSNLDCTTERGKTFIASQDEAAKLFAAHYGFDVKQTGADCPSDIDAMFYAQDRLMGIAEVKARDMTLAQLQKFGTYLITFDKLVRGANLARSLCASFILVVWLRGDRKMMYWKIADKTGRLVCPFEVKQSTTQETCNGGQIERSNAYLPVSSGCLVPI